MAGRDFIKIHGGFYRRDAVVAVQPVADDNVRVHLRGIKGREHIELSGQAAEKALAWAEQNSIRLESSEIDHGRP